MQAGEMTASESAWALGESYPPSGRQTALGFALVLVVMSVGLAAIVWLNFDEAGARGDFSPRQYDVAGLVIGASFSAAVLPVWWSRGRATLELIGFRRESPHAALKWTAGGLLIYAAVIAAALTFKSAQGQFEAGIAAALSTAMANVVEMGASVIFGVICVVIGEVGITIALLGVLLPWMRRRLSLATSAAILGFVLAALTVWFNPPGAVHLGALTFLSVFARERTRSIWPPMTMNVVYVAADTVILSADLGL